ncbi:MAG: hypothetical protein ABL986_19360 [Vicinamibacterales bacterium]
MRPARLLAVAILVFTAALVAQCARPAEPPASTAPVSALAEALTPVASVHEMMRDIIDPDSDLIFDAVGTDVTDKGVVQREPTTDEDWARVRQGAMTIAEAANLLKVPRKAAPDGYTFDPALRGPNAPELAPDAIAAKIEANRGVWNGMADGLRREAIKILQIVDAKDTAKLFQAGSELDAVCETCHLEFFYPGDRKAVIDERNKRATVPAPK